MSSRTLASLPLLLAVIVLAGQLEAQTPAGAMKARTAPPAAWTMPSAPADSHSTSGDAHAMWMQPLGSWSLMGMAQVFPAVTAGSPWREEHLLTTAGLYATQPVVMANLASPRSRLVLRTTFDFEAWTQPDGELTFGGWGEGFIDSRHPHTVLHEAMLTVNWWDIAGGALSVSAGKGFAPYGTDDPMARPALKFPTNHHLSQVLERWLVGAAWVGDDWGLEASLFGGEEPRDPYDLGNIESFGDSWSVRLSRRLGASDAVGGAPFAPWELSVSHARVAEAHHDRSVVTRLYSAAVRHESNTVFGRLYALAEGSMSDPDEGSGHESVLAEAALGAGGNERHRPYARVEYATRPEYERDGPPGTPGFFRYDHDAHEIGAMRWLITTVGYGYEASDAPVSVRPFVELQYHRVSAERGAVDPSAMYGGRSFWALSVGARVFLGGGPMRMGSYGALDPMTASMRTSAASTMHHQH